MTLDEQTAVIALRTARDGVESSCAGQRAIQPVCISLARSRRSMELLTRSRPLLLLIWGLASEQGYCSGTGRRRRALSIGPFATSIWYALFSQSHRPSTTSLAPVRVSLQREQTATQLESRLTQPCAPGRVAEVQRALDQVDEFRAAVDPGLGPLLLLVGEPDPARQALQLQLDRGPPGGQPHSRARWLRSRWEASRAPFRPAIRRSSLRFARHVDSPREQGAA